MEVKAESSDVLRSVKERYQEAEDAIKIVEHTHNKGMITPAINELRYAGNHILKALSSESHESQTEDLIRAERHCQRAIYDAIEVGALDCFAVFDVFQDDYKLFEVSEVCPEYNETLDMVDSVRNFVRDAQKSQKEDFYKELQKKYQPLKEAVDRLDRRRPQINVIMNKRRRRGFYVVAGLIVALLGVGATLYVGVKPSDAIASNAKYSDKVIDICVKSLSKVTPNIKLQEAYRQCQSVAAPDANQAEN